MAEFDNQKYPHPNHTKLHIYKRPKSEYWQCRFFHKGKEYRTTTKCSNKPDAEDFASDWYFNTQVNIKSGIIKTNKPKNIPTVKDASINAIIEYRVLVDQGKRSKAYLNGAIKVLNKHIIPYFGDVPVEDISKVKWNDFRKDLYTKNSGFARSTVHQIRNALLLCMNSAEDKGWISAIPNFKIESESNKDKKGRVWFKPDEQDTLLQALDDHVELLKYKPQRKSSLELRDYVKFILYSGLRVGEANKVKFADIEITKPTNLHLSNVLIRNIKGKSISGTCNADRVLISVINSIKDRVKPTNINQKLFQKHHRDMFNVVLKKCNLKFDIEGRKRDFISLRHTYISNKILDGLSSDNIRLNCRTSVEMIEKHYTRHLKAEMLNIHPKEDKAISEELNAISKIESKMEMLKNRMENDNAEFIALKSKNATQIANIYKNKLTQNIPFNTDSIISKDISEIMDYDTGTPLPRDLLINKDDPELKKSEIEQEKLIQTIADTIGTSTKEVTELNAKK